MIGVGRRILGLAISLFAAAWLISTAVGYIEQIITPLLIIGAVVVTAVIIIRIMRRNHWW